jgi:predicted DCC family thiol-disulfide oxidoreductase YuxK
VSALPDRIVLYDGVCGLCNATVKFLIQHDNGAFHYAPLQGETAAELKKRHPDIPENLDSVIYVEGGKVYQRSKVFLVAARHMAWPWRIGGWFRWLPGWMFDWAYRFVARIRYRVWGKYEACRLPDVSERKRLLP